MWRDIFHLGMSADYCHCKGNKGIPQGFALHISYQRMSSMPLLSAGWPSDRRQAAGLTGFITRSISHSVFTRVSSSVFSVFKSCDPGSNEQLNGINFPSHGHKLYLSVYKNLTHRGTQWTFDWHMTQSGKTERDIFISMLNLQACYVRHHICSNQHV